MKRSELSEDPLSDSFQSLKLERRMSADKVFLPSHSSADDDHAKADGTVGDRKPFRPTKGKARTLNGRLVLLPANDDPLEHERRPKTVDLSRRKSRIDLFLTTMDDDLTRKKQDKAPLFGADDVEEQTNPNMRQADVDDEDYFRDDQSLKGIATQAFFARLRKENGHQIAVTIVNFLHSFGLETATFGWTQKQRISHSRHTSSFASTTSASATTKMSRKNGTLLSSFGSSAHNTRSGAGEGRRAARIDRSRSLDPRSLMEALSLGSKRGKNSPGATANDRGWEILGEEGETQGWVSLKQPFGAKGTIVSDTVIKRAAEEVQEFYSSTELLMEKSDLWSGENGAMFTAALESLEAFVCCSIYDIVFGRSEEDVEKDAELRNRICKLQFIEPHHLEIPEKHQNAFSFALAQAEIRKINIRKSPREKLLSICQCCRTINSMLRLSCPNDAPGADDLLPILVMLILRAQPKTLFSDLNYIHRFRQSSRLSVVSESVCYLTHFYAAASFILSLDASHLNNIDQETFDFAVRNAERRIGGSISHLPLPPTKEESVEISSLDEGD